MSSGILVNVANTLTNTADCMLQEQKRTSRGIGKSKIKVLVELASPGASLLHLRVATIFLCPYMAFPLGIYTPGISTLTIWTPVLLNYTPTYRCDLV